MHRFASFAANLNLLYMKRDFSFAIFSQYMYIGQREMKRMTFFFFFAKKTLISMHFFSRDQFQLLVGPENKEFCILT
jgi:hypothetical protein